MFMFYAVKADYCMVVPSTYSTSVLSLAIFIHRYSILYYHTQSTQSISVKSRKSQITSFRYRITRFLFRQKLGKTRIFGKRTHWLSHNKTWLNDKIKVRIKNLLQAYHLQTTEAIFFWIIAKNTWSSHHPYKKLNRNRFCRLWATMTTDRHTWNSHSSVFKNIFS